MSGWGNESPLQDPYASDDPFADPAEEEDLGMEFVSLGGNTADITAGLDAGDTSGSGDFVSASGVWGDSGGSASSGFDTSSALGSGGGMGGGGTLDPSALGAVNPEALRAVQGSMSRGSDQRYLPMKHKSSWEVALHNIGTAYLLSACAIRPVVLFLLARHLAHRAVGVSLSVFMVFRAAGVSAGTFGFLSGVKNARNWRPRILLNSVLNNFSRYGSMTANTAGVLTLMYSATVWGLDRMEFDRIPMKLGLPRRDIYTPMAAAGITGFIYTAPSIRRGNPRTVATSVVATLGASASVALVAKVGPPILGRASPFSWE